MSDFLCFRLYGPMVAWGDIAIGERRPAVPQPSRSGVLGLLAGALGLLRTDSDQLALLDHSLGLASCLERRGELLVDYHTAQVPTGPEVRAARKRGVHIATRRAELAIKGDSNAIQSWRIYYLDALASACVWTTASVGPWTLDALARSLREPVFVPYLGRKACPLGLPMEPHILDAPNPFVALTKARFKVDALLDGLATQRAEPKTYCWEGSWPDLRPDKTVLRRDKLQHRERWQFLEREEHVRQVGGEPHVPEPT